MTEAEITWLRSEFLRCKPWIEAALERDAVATHDAEDVWELIKAGHAQLWPTPNSALVTKVDTYPKARVLQHWLAGGNMAELHSSESRVREWAKGAGCDFIAIAGRDGWARELKSKGYRKAFAVVVKDLRTE